MTGAEVYLEVGKRRTFACSLDWPGWCRSGKDEAAALEALAAYAPRYAVVAAEAGVPFPAGVEDDLEVRERLAGTTTTDFGAPGEVPAADGRPLTSRAAEVQTALVAASWAVLDRVAAAAPAELRKGPRGGGRDRDDVVRHVADAEVAYARKLGIQRPGSLGTAELRRLVVEAIRGARDGAPMAPKGWPPRYAARRIAWHALDHAWEIEDRSPPVSP